MGRRDGPLIPGEECGGEWMWTLQDCRRWHLTSEDFTPNEADGGEGSEPLNVRAWYPGTSDEDDDAGGGT